MSKTHKVLVTILFSFLILSFMVSPVYATSDVIDNLTIDVEVFDDGSAIVTEIWDTYAASGTENYKTFSNMDGASIEYLKVYEDRMQYENIPFWNSDLSREQKSYKSGIKKTGTDSYEIIWGIGNYGQHVYTVEYKINNFIYQYDKSAGVYWKFIGSDFDLPIKNLTFKMHRDGGFNYENVRIWSYGYDGGVYLDKGGTDIYGSGKNLDTLDMFEVKVVMPNEYVPNAEKRSGDIESIWLAEEEAKEKEYEREQFFYTVAAIAVGIIILIILFFIIKAIINNGKYKTKFNLGDEKYINSPPTDNYLLLNVMSHFRNKKDWAEHLFDAATLQLSIKGNVVVDKIDVLNDTKSNNIKISFVKEPDIEDNVEYLLYQYMKDASGIDGVLQPDEFKKYCEKNYRKTNKIYTSLEKELLRHLKANKYLVPGSGNQGCLFLILFLIGFMSPLAPLMILGIILYSVFGSVVGKTPFTSERLTDEGIEMHKQVERFKNYLEDYSALSEHSYTNAELWDTYMIYASAMGIADKVEKEFSKLNPQYIAERQTYYHTHHSVSRTFSSGMKSGMATYRSKTSSSSSGRGGGGGGRGGGGGGRR